MAKIIVSYRRSDSDAIAGRIRDRLSECYGNAAVFMDIDSIPFGKDFRAHVREAVLKEDIVLAIIGPKWTGRTKAGVSRINEETDPVRIELEIALERGIPVIPVLVGGASMPKADALPATLKDLPFLNAAVIDAGRDFHQHVDRLIRSTDSLLNIKSAELVPTAIVKSRRVRDPLFQIWAHPRSILRHWSQMITAINPDCWSEASPHFQTGQRRVNSRNSSADKRWDKRGSRWLSELPRGPF